MFFFFLFLIQLAPAWAGEGGSDLHLPPEFAPEVIQAEIEGNRLASTGKRKENSIEYDWSPEHAILTGKPKKIQAEYQVILESLRAYPLLMPLAKYVKVSPDGKRLDLTKFLSEINKSLHENCWNCFALVLCALNKNTRLMESEQLLGAIQGTHLKKKEDEARAGSIVIMRQNFSEEMPYHAYIWLSPVLALEKRGSGAVLIRPQSVIKEEYKDLASAERKYHKFVEGKKLPSFRSPIKIESWVAK